MMQIFLKITALFLLTTIFSFEISHALSHHHQEEHKSEHINESHHSFLDEVFEFLGFDHHEESHHKDINHTHDEHQHFEISAQDFRLFKFKRNLVDPLLNISLVHQQEVLHFSSRLITKNQLFQNIFYKDPYRYRNRFLLI